MQSHLIVAQAGGRNPSLLPSGVMNMTKYITHSESGILLWICALYITSCLLSDTGACDVYSQPASQAVSGSDQVVWPSGEPRGRQWPHCVAEVPLVSVTLPATETGRSKMAECREPCWCLSWFKQGSFDPFLEAAFLRGLVSELGALKRGAKQCSAPANLLAFYLF